ncbi:DeoR/GlpR family DNA-binding transcription regulator [Ferrimonas lipolytica]|uniref:DeoR/GlpR transcriptional regulator n=1 Tax=Ferrimonas lipolytica TaxID=2724191 RepID=A0A6H1UF26_9GAMM|nr:DeoR/GlpR family DNA-binding transcription regulator [Ferrimonas lipolytica]QIZ76943.1 DeoR/GlpR transcriptional regulator [Ferrimonas lipolytica]
MIPAERQRIILSMLEDKEICTIGELTDKLAVSHMTVRRDIAKLEEKGRVFSVAGGVQRIESVREEQNHKTKSTQNLEIKLALGRACMPMVAPQATVYLDAGTTTLEIARAIAHREDILVITNDLFIADYLAEHGTCEYYLTGGRIDRGNHSCIGDMAASFISRLNVDVAFVSATCWDRRGVSSPSEGKVMVKKALAAVAKQSILVSDSSKFGRTGTFLGMESHEFDMIITDEHLPQNYKELLLQLDVELVEVQP